MLKVRATSLQGLKLALWAVLPHNAKREVGSVSGRRTRGAVYAQLQRKANLLQRTLAINRQAVGLASAVAISHISESFCQSQPRSPEAELEPHTEDAPQKLSLSVIGRTRDGLCYY
jgi:hypothetical protein